MGAPILSLFVQDLSTFSFHLASNSLLESLVFAKRAATHIVNNYSALEQTEDITVDAKQYEGYADEYKKLVLDAIEKEKNSHE